jgi:hypothetical protein
MIEKGTVYSMRPLLPDIPLNCKVHRNDDGAHDFQQGRLEIRNGPSAIMDGEYKQH